MEVTFPGVDAAITPGTDWYTSTFLVLLVDDTGTFPTTLCSDNNQ